MKNGARIHSGPVFRHFPIPNSPFFGTFPTLFRSTEVSVSLYSARLDVRQWRDIQHFQYVPGLDGKRTLRQFPVARQKYFVRQELRIIAN